MPILPSYCHRFATNAPQITEKRVRKVSEQKFSFKCGYAKCNVHNKIPGVTFTKLPRKLINIDPNSLSKPWDVWNYS